MAETRRSVLQKSVEAGMASLGSGLSGLALRDDRDDVESSKQWHSGSTLESYVLPTNLRIDDNETNLALSCMEVIKVSKNGKQQTRHLGISSNHRSILITSNRPQGKVKGLLKRNIAAAADGGNIHRGAGAASSAANTPVNELDLSTIVRLQLGQQSRRFFKARAKSNNVQNSSAHPQSLSIVYRRPTNTSTVAAVGSAVKDSLARMPLTPSGNNQVRMDAGEDSLDLIIPSKSDFDALLRTLEDLLEFYKEDEPYSNQDLSFVQFHLEDLGKRLGNDVKVSCHEWVNLCKRFNAPVSKSEATTMYRKLSPETDGIDIHGVLILMNKVKASTNKAFKDPRDKLFQKMAISKTEGVQRRIASSPTGPPGAFVKGFGDGDAAGLRTTDNKCQVVSARAFLDFLHDKQKETDISIDDVHDLFYQLNGHRLSKELEDTMSLVSGMKSAPHGVSWEKEFITWEVFTKYLMLESNDVFNPDRAKPSSCVMTEPLNNYWINTSHDTFLYRTKELFHDQKVADKTDLQSYTLALYHGARAIELDVWDGQKGPVVRYGETNFPDNTITENSTKKATRSVSSLKFSDVLQTIAYFLQSEPKSFPIILLIENHCSLPFQEIMAKNIESILGGQGFLYTPDPKLTPTSALPSPADLIGKVLIKSKRAMSGESTVLNDDFDDENRIAAAPESDGYDSEDDVYNNVVAFTSSGSIKTEAKNNATYEQLFKTAKHDATEANATAKSLSIQYDDATRRAAQAQNHADALLRDVGMSYEELKKKRGSGSDHVAEEGTEIVFDGEVAFDEDRVVVKGAENKAAEIAAAFAETVEESRLVFSAASAEARSETELFEIARQDLAEMEMILAEAKEALEEVSNRNRRLKEAAERGLAEARSNREYADNAESRVAAVKALLDKSHDQAVSSETVAGTADAEAKISEERACEAEARARKARAKADSEKEKANKVSKKEDELEEKLASYRKVQSELIEAINSAQQRADDAVAMSDKLTDEIREAKSGSFDGDAKKVAERKLKERQSCMKNMDVALAEKLTLEKELRDAENKFEDLRRKTKLQAKAAASAHKQADQLGFIADQLEDHALEEREAANLRNTACAKAKQSVKNYDAVLTSTETQLSEAERAAEEARELAIVSREKAEQLTKDATEGVQDTSSLEEDVSSAQIDCEAFQSVYDLAKESKEKAVWRAAEARLAHEKNCLSLASLERDAMSELLQKEHAQQAELLAANAWENAKALAEIAKDLKEDLAEANSVAAEKAGALAIATRFKEKKRRVQPISQTLSKLTLLHNCSHRTWAKSMKKPNWTVHNFPDQKIVKMAEVGKEEWTKMVEFNKNHFSRAYPPSSSRNYNPLLPWAMGCQFSSMNFTRNKFMLLNDGRFRENGNTGYVLKPEYLCSDSLGDLDDAMGCHRPRKVTIRILSGFCLPKSIDIMPGIQKRTINPFVVVTLYDGSPASLLPPPTFSSGVVKGNGLNPIWDENEAASFTCLNPALGIVSFAVYDHDDVSKKDLFIGGAAIPVSCMREGYRCVSLFDSNNSRSGAMKFSSLLVNVKII
ncbi:hypothetical protein ACHAWT_007458 [Skeletonema menzelii]